MSDTPLDMLPLGNDGSSPQAPPADGNETPSDNPSPSGSNSPESPPAPDSSNPTSDSPPPDSSNTPPPPDSNNTPPPPPDPNNTPSGNSSPPPDTNTPSSPSDSSPPPPPPPESDSSPPSDSNNGSPPPPPLSDDNNTPSEPPPPPSDNNNTPSESSPDPKSSNDSPPTDNGSKSSPPSSDNQNSPNTDNQPPPQRQESPPSRDGAQSNRSSSHVPELSGPSTHSSRTSSTPLDSASSSKSDGTINVGTVAGATVAGVLIIAFIALFFVIARRRKRRPLDYYDPYRPQPPNYSGNSDGYYYGGPPSQPHSQQHSAGMPGGHSQEYYSGGRPPAYPNSGPMNSYGSYKGPDSGTLGGAQSSFTYDELMGITEGFSRQNIIGEGGFGAVYKGHLPDGRIVAVKQLKAGSGQGEREFRAEVDIISRVHHRHLVSLVGYCIADAQRLLVYEFVPNNTLEHHIHTPGLPVLDWSKRVRIAIGAARGLAYLHEDCHPKIIHRDIKSANILLDDVYEAQVADFGLAKLSNDISTHVSTRVMGTFGYMAPEYASSGKLTDRSDVFSFGVVLLELVTGRRPVEASQDDSLVEWARPLIASAIETGDFSELADPRLEKRYVESEMFRMAETAAACVRHSANKRPRMVQVLRALDTDGDMPDINNGVKVGQSTIFEANSDLQKFRMLALGGDDTADYSMHSGSMNSRAEILPPKPPPGWSGESETRAINPRKW